MNELYFRTEISELLCRVSSGYQGERANPYTPKKKKRKKDRNRTRRRDRGEKTAVRTVILHPSDFSRNCCPKSLSAEETFSPFVFLCTGSPPAVINKTSQPSHLPFFFGLMACYSFPSLSPLVFKCQSRFFTSYLSFPFASLFIVSRH